MLDYTLCTLCKRGGSLATSQDVRAIPSNVRRFRTERFTVWRCVHCASIHARDLVDLDHYYAHYPMHALTLSRAARLTYRNRLKRLIRDGLTPDSRILDYGSGSGVFVEFLLSAGFTHAQAHDPHVPDAAAAIPKSARFDFVLLYDVIEHFDAPEQIFDVLAGHTHAESAVCVFTPDAAQIDLGADIHTLHQPYHRHVFSPDSLVDMFRRHGYGPSRTSRRHHADTLLPFLNHRVIKEYMKVHGYLLDSLFEDIHVGTFVRHPKLILWGLLGYLFPSRSHVEVLFRRAPR